MTPRAYVLIFFFWSLLTILTPALVFLSENSKTSSLSSQSPDGKIGGIQMSRKIVGLTRKYEMLKVLVEEQTSPAAIPTPITAPAPAPSTALPPGTAVPLRRFMAGAGKVIVTTLKGLSIV
ncbi:uncharacterized protein LOC111496365 [Cucurbita maxima]|uniref:Uncharacterized protein LOC111496365 n=1 Tax=Cucurbita maxima TaxID=3661 RepID=A0A6J1KQS2_CUCMA|nr:uncharacterized protein LOC111496365 [Cucurbita maxima]